MQRTHRQSLRSFLFAAELDIVRHHSHAPSVRLESTPVIRTARPLGPAVSDLFTTCGLLFLAQFAGQWLNFAWIPVANRIGRGLIVSHPVSLAPYILFTGLAGAVLPFVLRSARPLLWSVLVGVLSGYSFAVRSFALADMPERVRHEVRLGYLLTAGLCLSLPIAACFLTERLNRPRIAASGA